jgi:ribosomal-protein-alanine N-acetyltransferase
MAQRDAAGRAHLGIPLPEMAIVTEWRGRGAYCDGNGKARGQGYATEACRAVLGHAFDGLQAQSVVSGTAAANRPSCRLLERLGFQKTGESMGSFRNAPDGEPIEFLAFSYALTREAWEVAGQ